MRRARLYGRLHDCQRLRAQAEAGRAREVRAARASAGRRPGRRRRSPGGHRRRRMQGALLGRGSAPHSDDAFVQAFPAETTEAFCEGHNAAFRYFGGVPRGIVYDNTTLAVAKMLGDGTRQRTQSFSERHCTTCSTIASDGRGRATTKARWKGWSATPAATSSCRSRASLVGTR